MKTTCLAYEFTNRGWCSYADHWEKHYEMEAKWKSKEQELRTKYMTSNNKKTDIPNPGSQEARDAGCTCPVLDNGHGRGYMGQPGVFVKNETCPIHGMNAAKKKENGK